MKSVRKALESFIVNNDSDNEDTLVARFIIDSGITSLREAAELSSSIQDAAAKITALLLKEADKWVYSLELTPDQTYDTFADAVEDARELTAVDDSGRQIIIGHHETGE